MQMYKRVWMKKKILQHQNQLKLKKIWYLLFAQFLVGGLSF